MCASIDIDSQSIVSQRASVSTLMHLDERLKSKTPFNDSRQYLQLMYTKFAWRNFFVAEFRGGVEKSRLLRPRLTKKTNDGRRTVRSANINKKTSMPAAGCSRENAFDLFCFLEQERIFSIPPNPLWLFDQNACGCLTCLLARIIPSRAAQVWFPNYSITPSTNASVTRWSPDDTLGVWPQSQEQHASARVLSNTVLFTYPSNGFDSHCLRNHQRFECSATFIRCEERRWRKSRK